MFNPSPPNAFIGSPVRRYLGSNARNTARTATQTFTDSPDFFTFYDAEGSPGTGWDYYGVDGRLDLDSGSIFTFDFRQVRNLEEDAYYAWEVINASGGIAIDGIEQDGDFIPAEFLGIGAFSG
ncbi:MAG: hypothetical protein AAGK14_03860, partial [Verrucomicrobiota bacterium]